MSCPAFWSLRKSIDMKLQINGEDRDFIAPLTLAGLVEMTRTLGQYWFKTASLPNTRDGSD